MKTMNLLQLRAETNRHVARVIVDKSYKMSYHPVYFLEWQGKLIPIGYGKPTDITILWMYLEHKAMGWKLPEGNRGYVPYRDVLEWYQYQVDRLLDKPILLEPA